MGEACHIQLKTELVLLLLLLLLRYLVTSVTSWTFRYLMAL